MLRETNWKGTVSRCAAVILTAGFFAAPTTISAPTVGATVSGRVPTKAARHSASPGYTLPPNVKAACPFPPPSGKLSCTALVRTDIPAQAGLLAGAPNGYGPADLRSAYKLTQASADDGSGETVALIDAYDDPNAESDLAVYRAQYGLPPCTTANGCFKKVNQSGQQGPYPKPDHDWGLEESLDLDMVSAICPLCHILLVEATNDGLTDLPEAAQEAVTLGVKFESNSYGTGLEFPGQRSLDKYYDHPGVAVTVAAGDWGYGTSWPASSEYVTAVGGTSLLRASNARGWDEIAWSGTGSGCSVIEAKPPWQSDPGCRNRTVADVAADADPDEGGVATYDTYGWGGWLVVGGTSVASPTIASVYALAGTPVPGSYPAEYPYVNFGYLYDIVAGTNSLTGCTPTYLCTAGPGYDGPTGMGTPDGIDAFLG
jgi:subtilase family serine protease